MTEDTITKAMPAIDVRFVLDAIDESIDDMRGIGTIPESTRVFAKELHALLGKHVGHVSLAQTPKLADVIVIYSGQLTALVDVLQANEQATKANGN